MTGVPTGTSGTKLDHCALAVGYGTESGLEQVLMSAVSQGPVSIAIEAHQSSFCLFKTRAHSKVRYED